MVAQAERGDSPDHGLHADEILRTGHSVIVESNFKADLDASRFKRLRNQHGVSLVQVLCWAEGDVLFERCKLRIESGDRHPGHAEVDSLETARAHLVLGRAEPLPINGPTIEVDTTQFDLIDYSTVFRAVSSPA